MCDSSVGVLWRGEGERIFNPEVVDVGTVSRGSKEKKKMPVELLKAWGTFQEQKSPLR